MPSTYAHYRMGVVILPTLPADVRRTIQRFRRLFDVGLHGPDIFFYYNPLLPTAVGNLGSKFHEQTGREFFQRVCRVARLEKSEAAQAYIYGALCHYVLDSYLYPFEKEQAALGTANLQEIEAEFERYLLELDGKCPPEAQDLSKHLQLTPGECDMVAKLYSPVTSRQLQGALKNMARCTKLVAVPEGKKRTALRKTAELMGHHISSMLMPTGPNAKCAHLDAQLVDVFHRACTDFPEFLSQLQAHLTYNGVFGEEFTKIFG